MQRGKLAARNRIALSMILPVFLVGLTISALSVYFWTKPVISYIQNRTEADLRLASSLGLAVCEERLQNLISLRLENDPEMIASSRAEAIEEVLEVSKKLHQIHILIVENGDTVIGSSVPTDGWSLPNPARGKSAIFMANLGQQPVRMHYQYFPLWRWHIVSFIYEKDYMGPILLAERTVYVVSLSVLLLITVTVFFLFNRMVNTPIRKIIRATEGIAHGRYVKLDMQREDEIGQVALAFDYMVGSLKDDKDRISSIMWELKESEERYRLLTENSLAYIFMVQDDRFLYANKTTVEMCGYSSDELCGMNIFELIHPDDRESVKQKISLRQGDSIADHYEFRYLTKAGETRWLEMLSVPTQYKGKNVILGHAIDVTDRKVAQEEQKKLEGKLQQAQKMEALGTIVGTVAHDLNNILAGLVGYPDILLLETPETSDQRKYILAIQQSGQKAAAIVQDLLTMVRRGVAVKQVVNLNDIIADYLKSPEFEKLKDFHRNVRFQSDLDPDLFNTQGSLVHLSKTVMNLISNAAEASPEGGTIRITTANRYIDLAIPGYDGIEEGDYVVLSVSDTGVGISSDDLARIFEPFYTKKVMGRSGTGLGMAVVWSTVKDHGGYIHVQSREGEGAIFDLFFPATRKNLPDKKSIASFETYRGTERILVIDDIREQREIASEMLARLGYSVTAVSSGDEAVSYLRAHTVDLLVLDMIMEPGIDGLETYKRIIELRPGQRAIIASGFSETARVKEAQRLGAGNYVMKPYTFVKLASAVRSELDKPRDSAGKIGAAVTASDDE